MTKKKEMCSSANVGPGVGIVMIKISQLHGFKNHPFKVERNLELFEFRQSIEKEGVLVPLLVRSNPDGNGYEIIAGHRRKEAAEWAGLTEVPAIIREFDDNQSIIAMVDSNLQREKILPSEKAFAYKMKLEALKHQGKRNDLTSSQVGTKLENPTMECYQLYETYDEKGKWNLESRAMNSDDTNMRADEIMARQLGESRNQIARYIRLTNLIPKILQMVDEEKLALTSAVELSFLKEKEQYELHAVMDLEQSIPSLSQANRLKRMSQQGKLDMESICEIMEEVKPNQKEQVRIPLERISKYFPAEYTPAQQVNLIEKLLCGWARQNQKKMEEA